MHDFTGSTCPRCRQLLERYPFSGLSFYDNDTVICAMCEAFELMERAGTIEPWSKEVYWNIQKERLMSFRHRSCRRGCKVRAKLRDGGVVIGKFKEKNDRYLILFDHPRIPWNKVETFVVYKKQREYSSA